MYARVYGKTYTTICIYVYTRDSELEDRQHMVTSARSIRWTPKYHSLLSVSLPPSVPCVPCRSLNGQRGQGHFTAPRVWYRPPKEGHSGTPRRCHSSVGQIQAPWSAPRSPRTRIEKGKINENENEMCFTASCSQTRAPHTSLSRPDSPKLSSVAACAAGSDGFGPAVPPTRIVEPSVGTG